jgi:hypothetical protein
VIGIDELLNSIQLPVSPIEITEVSVSGPVNCLLDVYQDHYLGNEIKFALKEVDGTVYRVEVEPQNITELSFDLEIKLQYSSLDMKPQIIIK